jgi:hypothetical protein
MTAAAKRLAPLPSTSRYGQRIAIVDGLRRAFEKFKHHHEFTRRTQRCIEAELPAFTVSVSSEYGRHSIRVWGAGIEFRDALHVSWSPNGASWAGEFEAAVDVVDCRDREERAADEELLCPTLAAMDEQIRRLRLEAAAMIKALPVPPSAKTRADPMYWEGPSVALKERFAALF